MKIWTVPLLLLATSPALASIATQEETIGEEEIVVTAQITRIGFTLGRNKQRKAFCQITKSSGDPKLDDFTCREIAKCVTRKKMSEAQVNACIDKRKPGLAKRWLKEKRKSA